MSAVVTNLVGREGGPVDEEEKEEEKEEACGTTALSTAIVGDDGSFGKTKRKRTRGRRSSGGEGVPVSEESQGPKKIRRSHPGRVVRHRRIYDSFLGKTCHWCRQKTVERHVCCSRPGCTVKFCWRCLLNRNGEVVEAEMAPQVLWVCPKCRGGCGPGCKNCCNCGPCRKTQGLEPTGPLVHEAKKHGFSNVHDYLVHQVTGEGQDALAARKQGRCWTSDGGPGITAQELEQGVGSVEEAEAGVAMSREEEGEAAGRGDVETGREGRGRLVFETFRWEVGGMTSISLTELLGRTRFEAVSELSFRRAHLPPGESPAPTASCRVGSVKVEIEVAGTADNVSFRAAADVPAASETGGWSLKAVKVEIEVAGTANNVSSGAAADVPAVSETGGWSLKAVKVEAAEAVPGAATVADRSVGTVKVAGAEDVLAVGEAGGASGEPQTDGHVGANSSAAGAPPGCHILESVNSEPVNDVLEGAGTCQVCEDSTRRVSHVEDSCTTDGPALASSHEDVKFEVEEVLFDVTGTQQVLEDPTPSSGLLLAKELEVANLELGEDVPAAVTGPVADILSEKEGSEIALSVQDGSDQTTNRRGMHAATDLGSGFEQVGMEEGVTGFEECLQAISSQQFGEANVGDMSQIYGLCRENREAATPGYSEEVGVTLEGEESGDYCDCGYFDTLTTTERNVIYLSDSEPGNTDGNKVGSLTSQAEKRQLPRISRRSLDQWKPTPSKRRVRERVAKLSVREPCEDNWWPSGEKGNEFQEKLDAFVREPFNEQELLDRMDLAKRRKPKEKVRQMRQRVVVCRTTEKGFSYLDHYPGLAEKLSSATDKAEKLTLLRGFFFWLQHSMLPGAFQPWNKGQDKDGEEDDCVEVDPDCEVVAVFAPVDGKPAGATNHAGSLPKADASRGPASGKVSAPSVVRRSLNFSSEKGSPNSKRGR